MMEQTESKETHVSIVIPVCDEEGNLRELSDRIRDVMKKGGVSYEVLMIDDGSKDSSFKIMQELHSADDRIKAIRLRRNFGKSNALDIGFSEAKGEVIITMDADLQDDPDEIPRFLKEIEQGKDLVSGWRSPRRDGWIKRLLSRFFNRVTSLMTGVKLHDFNCGFKAYRIEVVRAIRVYGGLHRYLPILANWQGFDVGEIKVRHHPRKAGRTKYGIERITRGFFDLLTVMFLTRYTTRPLHLFGGMGMLFALAGFAINLYITALRFRFGNIMGRFPLLILGILLMIVGIQLISTGLLADMIANLHHRKDQTKISRKL